MKIIGRRINGSASEGGFMPEFFTDLETLAKSTGLIRGEIAFVLWANDPPKILIPHSERGDIDSSKCLVDCSLTVEVVTEALRGEGKGMESDIVMDGRILDTWAQFRPQVGDEALVIRLQGLIAVKSTGISADKTYTLNTHRMLGLSGRTTGRFVELCRKHRSVEAYFMAPSNQPRLK